MKTFPVFFLLFVLAYYQLTAQIIDDFSDGNFTVNPSWYGATGDFIVNASGQLQLNATAAGKSWMYADFQVTANQRSVWEFYVKQSFAPSGANFGRFYLMSDEANLSGPLNGYFLQFGEAGSADAVELFRQTGTALTSVCRAASGAIASSFAIRVRVARENNGDWQVLIAYDGTSNFVAEAFGNDGVHQRSLFSGVLCSYTITNASRFYYDDIYVSTVDAGDHHPPHLVSLAVMTSRSLQATFSEDMDSASVSDPLMYWVPEISLHAESSKLQADNRTVTLSFANDFQNGHQHTLDIGGVTDVAGNVLSDTIVSFLFFQSYPVHFKDIVITEILADPSPTVGLPEVEYVELYNRGMLPVALSGWTLSDQSTSGKLEDIILLPRTYLLLTTAAEKFNALINVMDMALPSLNNSGDVIKLKDPAGMTIDSVAYSDAWYTDDDTKDGGWSLELIDPENICAGSRNWAACESASGGTPGKENSVKAILADNTGPVVLSVIPSDSVTLNIVFDEALDKRLPTADHFQIDPAMAIVNVHYTSPSLTTVEVILGTPLKPGETYTITLNDIYDCSGNPLREELSSFQFVIPQKSEQADVVINEILFNPMPQGVDFVEVYNCSDKVIDLQDWSLANTQSHDGNKSVVVSRGISIIRPGEYIVFTEDLDILKGEYIAGDERTFREIDLPAFNDDEGAVVIRDGSGRMIDSVFYSEDYHNAFVRDGEGISLERISTFASGMESSNWRSASAQTGFATPGYANSNARTQGLPGEAVTIEPEVIQPDIDALSFALIRYQFERGGLMANVRVLDQHGRWIREIASNELLGGQGFFRWDGDLDDGSAAGVGYYMVWFEIFDADGMVQVIRKRLAVF